MKAMQDEKDFPQRGRNATFLPGARITEIFFTSSALLHPEGNKLIFLFCFVFHKRSYFSLTFFFSEKTTMKFLTLRRIGGKGKKCMTWLKKFSFLPSLQAKT